MCSLHWAHVTLPIPALLLVNTTTFIYEQLFFKKLIVPSTFKNLAFIQGCVCKIRSLTRNFFFHLIFVFYSFTNQYSNIILTNYNFSSVHNVQYTLLKWFARWLPHESAHFVINQLSSEYKIFKFVSHSTEENVTI